jgi:hypothetical protein
MRTTFYSASGSFDILPGHELLTFYDEPTAVAFLRNFAENVGIMQEVRRVVADQAYDVSRLSNEEALQRFASCWYAAGFQSCILPWPPAAALILARWMIPQDRQIRRHPGARRSPIPRRASIGLSSGWWKIIPDCPWKGWN